nr:LemA family protein [uncultured Roseateles sp.]
MSAFSWLLVGLVAVLLFWGIGAYNRIMRLRNKIGEAYAQLDQHLVARSKLVASLMDLLRPELVTEQAAFDALHAAQADCDAAAAAVRARPAAADPVAQLAVAVAVHAAALTRLLALLDQHPELRAREDIQPPLDELRATEQQRSFARQLFNEAVRVYNEATHQFPTRILAGIYGFKEARSL